MKIADTDQEESNGVAVGLYKFQIVAGVPPASGDIDHGASSGQIAGKSPVLVHIRSEINLCALIVQMSGSSAQWRCDKVWTIALVLVKEERVRERGCIEIGSGVNAESGRICCD